VTRLSLDGEWQLWGLDRRLEHPDELASLDLEPVPARVPIRISPSQKSTHSPAGRYTLHTVPERSSHQPLLPGDVCQTMPGSPPRFRDRLPGQDHERRQARVGV
jgi:hypothetical protein